MSSCRPRPPGLSFSVKLTLWFVLVFFVIEATLVGLIVFLRHSVIETALDESLTASAETMIDNIVAAEANLSEAEIKALQEF